MGAWSVCCFVVLYSRHTLACPFLCLSFDDCWSVIIMLIIMRRPTQRPTPGRVPRTWTRRDDTLRHTLYCCLGNRKRVGVADSFNGLALRLAALSLPSPSTNLPIDA